VVDASMLDAGDGGGVDGNGVGGREWVGEKGGEKGGESLSSKGWVGGQQMNSLS
jgi:hypothetical protein